MKSPIKISPFARRSSGGGVVPVNTVAPVVSGTLEVGQTLTCSTGTWTGIEPITYSYQWKRGVTNIGTDSNTYVSVLADEGENITCTVTATNDYGSDSAVSNTVIIELFLQTLFNDYSGRNQWSAQNSTVVGTTTTWIDYAGSHNLSNPGAGNQPVTNNPDGDFNNKKSATFSTDDYLIKNTANYGAGQTTGSFWAIIKTPASFNNKPFFSVCDATTNLAQIYIGLNAFGYPIFVVSDGVTTLSIRGNTLLSINTEYILEFESDGSTTSIYVNGVLQGVTLVLGTNVGQWFSFANNGNTLDNIVIGAKINTSSLYFSGKVALIGNYPLLSAGDRAAMFNGLNSYYNVY